LALLTLTFVCFEIAGFSQSVGDRDSKRGTRSHAGTGRPEVYIGRVISVRAAGRDAFVSCLRQSEVPVWQKLKRDGLLADESVFEMSSLNISAPGVPSWNFLILSHIPPGVKPDAFFKAEKKQKDKVSPGPWCEDAPGVVTRRVEVLRSTPNAYYPRPPTENRTPDAPTEFTVPYIIEYIAVRETPAVLNKYREAMRLNVGPAVGLLIREEWLLNLIALETVSVKYAQSGMPGWNQIHIRGLLPDKGSRLAAFDGALRRVNPQGGGYAGIFGGFDSIRTKPREEIARQLSELAIR
jgi:hypothetical protein